jgi:serine/threonine-protein kinase RsbW
MVVAPDLRTQLHAGVAARIDIKSVHLPENTAERGRGLAIARSLLTELSYRRNPTDHWMLVSHRFDAPATIIAPS